MLAAVGRLPARHEHRVPLQPPGASQVNKDRTIAFADVTFDEQAQNVANSVAVELVQRAQSADRAGLTVAVSGQVAEQAIPPSIGGTGLGVLLAGVVLLLVFGSLFAMALPARLGTGVARHGDRHHRPAEQRDEDAGVLDAAGAAHRPRRRHRLRAVHRDPPSPGPHRRPRPETSIVNAVNTSGRAVLFAGIIVCIALLGMFALGVSFLYGLAVSAAIGVAFTMVAALTLLPALLGLHRAEGAQPPPEARPGRRRVRGSWARAPRASGRGGRRSSVARPVDPAPSWPWSSSWSSPCRSSRCVSGSADQGNDPVGTTTRQAYDMLATGFGPGFNGPLMLVAVERPGADRRRALDRAAGRRRPPARRGQRRPRRSPRRPGAARRSTLINVYPKSAPQDAATTDLIDHLRRQTIPAAVAGTGLTVLRGRHDRHLRRLRQRAVAEAAAVHRPRRGAVVPAPRGRLPEHRDPAHRRGHEPAVDRRRLRGSRRRLPARDAWARCSG